MKTPGALGARKTDGHLLERWSGSPWLEDQLAEDFVPDFLVEA